MRYAPQGPTERLALLVVRTFLVISFAICLNRNVLILRRLLVLFSMNFIIVKDEQQEQHRKTKKPRIYE